MDICTNVINTCEYLHIRIPVKPISPYIDLFQIVYSVRITSNIVLPEMLSNLKRAKTYVLKVIEDSNIHFNV